MCIWFMHFMWICNAKLKVQKGSINYWIFMLDNLWDHYLSYIREKLKTTCQRGLIIEWGKLKGDRWCVTWKFTFRWRIYLVNFWKIG